MNSYTFVLTPEVRKGALDEHGSYLPWSELRAGSAQLLRQFLKLAPLRATESDEPRNFPLRVGGTATRRSKAVPHGGVNIQPTQWALARYAFQGNDDAGAERLLDVFGKRFFVPAHRLLRIETRNAVVFFSDDKPDFALPSFAPQPV